MIDHVIEDLKCFRENIDHELDDWYSVAQKMITAVGKRESKPRTTKYFSAHRDNAPRDDIKSYWQRRSVAVPVMDNLIPKLTERMSDCSHASLFMLLPFVMFSHNDETYGKKLQEIFLGLEINYATRKDFLQEVQKPRKHLSV